MLLPIFLILLAAGAAVIMAFGTSADLARYQHGLDVILLSRRFQWPLVMFSLLCCVTLLFLVISNKRRAWWLIALGPITALFVYRFSLSADNFWSIADNPPMLAVDEVTHVRDDDWVVGVEFGENAYAFPYQALYSTPVVIQSERERRMMLLWSPFANVAHAYNIDREIKSRELDIVSMPANALLLYNTRNGQFVNGITGMTPKGAIPNEFKAEITATKTTWKKWKASHADTKVMVATGRLAHNPPAAPVLPAYPLPPALQDDASQNARIAVVPTTQPTAIPTESITPKPMNLMAGKLPVLIFRDAATGEVKAYERRIDEDLMPRFQLNRDLRRKGVVFVDSDTNTGWTADLVSVEEKKEHEKKEFKAKKLRPIEVQEDLYWGVMKYWYPDLEMTNDQTRMTKKLTNDQ